MTFSAFVRAAVAVSVGNALFVDDTKLQDKMWWTLTKVSRTVVEFNLPRTVVEFHDNHTCGKELPGYVMIEGLLWENSGRYGVRNVTDCMRACDSSKTCTGFTSRVPKYGRMQCNLYKGLHREADHEGMSYTKCAKGLHSDCLGGFQFSHAGTWRNGVRMKDLDGEDLGACAKGCYTNRACVAFTHRVTSMSEETECWHFESEGNKEGPQRDTRAHTYSKCAVILEESRALGSAAGQGEAAASEEYLVRHSPFALRPSPS